MIKEFIQAWDKNKEHLKEAISKDREVNECQYEYLVKLLFDNVINRDKGVNYEKYDTKNILVIDDGDYQGTQIFILHKETYQSCVLMNDGDQ